MAVLGIVLGVVIYALAVDVTGVSLDQITSDTRQAQLVRIIRSLARPELVTYDFEDDNTDVEFFIPCGDDSPATSGGVIVTPGCGNPGDMVTVSGTGFDAFVEGRIQFIPDSEFDVSLPLTLFQADENGEFSEVVELPERPSDIAQIIRVQVPNRLGTWGDRQEVWTDTNENGIRDDGIVTADGLNVTVEGASPDVPAAALLDPSNQVVDYVSTGESVVAVDGPANGLPSVPIEEATGDVRIVDLDTEGNTTLVTVEAAEGTDLSSWRVAIYEGTTGTVIGTEPMGDQIELSPRVSEQAELTLEAIIATVFLALVATTVGLTVALPLSFVAARNLMKDVSTTVIGLGLGLIAVPIGVFAGLAYVDFQRWVLGDLLDTNVMRLAMVVGGGLVTYYLGRQIFFGQELRSTALRTARSIATLVSTSLALEGAFALLTAGGDALEPAFGVFGFVPSLFATIGEVGTVLLPFIVGLMGASIVLGVARRLAFWLTSHLSGVTRAVIGYLSMAIAGAVVAALIGWLIDWLYQIANPTATRLIPAIIGAVIGLIIALVRPQKRRNQDWAHDLLHRKDDLQHPPLDRAARDGHCLRRLGRLRRVRRIPGPGPPYCGRSGQALLGAGRVDFRRTAGSREGNRSQSIAIHHLRGGAPDRPSLHCLHDVPLGHQRPHVDDPRFRRWWRHRVPTQPERPVG